MAFLFFFLAPSMNGRAQLLDSVEGEAFICDRKVEVPLQPKIRVLYRFQAQDPKIGLFVKQGSLRALMGDHPICNTSAQIC